ncbi:MAG: stalk domain-containing protein [Bacillota bacterium]|nr:stalk domain-containing protein [Bacillota bacterium]
MKKFLSGFLSGAIIFGAISGFAVSYVANPVNFKVLVNGKEFVSDPPALEVDGHTYLPLRSMGEALGVPVVWNDKLNQAEVGNQAAVAASGEYSRTNPAPLNTVQTYTDDDEYSSVNYTAAIRVIKTIRGDEALQAIRKANMFNHDPKDGYEYIIVEVAFSVLSVKGDGYITANSYNFDFYSANNEEYEKTLVVFSDELNKNLYAGGNTDGYVIGQIKKDDASPKIAYGLKYDGTGGVWFALQ